MVAAQVTAEAGSSSKLALASAPIPLSLKSPLGCGSLGRETQANTFLLGEVTFVRHPAGDLTPEPVVKLVLHAAPPSPRAVGAHEQDLASAGVADGEHEILERRDANTCSLAQIAQKEK